MRDINLIPKEYIRQKNKKKRLIAAAASALCLVAILAAFYISQLQRIEMLATEVQAYDSAVNEYNALKSKLAESQQNEELLEKRLEVLRSISGNEVKPTEALQLISSKLPKDVWLLSIDYTFSDVTLTAVSNTAEGAVEFYNGLAGLKELKDVKLSPIAKDEQGYNFSIIFLFDTGSDADGSKKAK